MFVDGGGRQGKRGELQDGAFSELDDARLEDEIGLLASHIASATCRWLLMVAEFERRSAHEDRGFPDAVSWLAWRCSVARRTAFENLRVARALTGLPKITAAFARGHLSYSKVRALTRVADEENEQQLVELALEATAAQLDRILNGYRRAISDHEAEAIAERRHVALSWQEDGSLRLSGELPPEEGALVVEALELVRQRLDEAGGHDDRPDLADALLALAEMPRQGGGDSMAGDRGARESEVVVHVDIADLQGQAEKRSNATVDPVGQPLAPVVAKRLACDAAIVSIIERDGEPLSVGRRTRSIPPAIARALRSRDHGCRFPGCGRTKFVDAHHLRHWIDGGETKLSNLVQLCRHHHRLVHEGRMSVKCEEGRLVFRDAGGELIPDVPPLADGSVLGRIGPGRNPSDRSRTRRAVDPWSIGARSRGAPFDLGLTVAGLLQGRDPLPAAPQHGMRE